MKILEEEIVKFDVPIIYLHKTIIIDYSFPAIPNLPTIPLKIEEDLEEVLN